MTHVLEQPKQLNFVNVPARPRATMAYEDEMLQLCTPSVHALPRETRQSTNSLNMPGMPRFDPLY